MARLMLALSLFGATSFTTAQPAASQFTVTPTFSTGSGLITAGPGFGPGSGIATITGTAPGPRNSTGWSSNPGLDNPNYSYGWLNGNAGEGYGICGLFGASYLSSVSVDSATLSSLVSSLSSFYATYTFAHPMPTILTQAPSDLSTLFTSQPSLYASAWAHIAPYANSSDISYLSSLLTSLSAPSSLSSEFFAFVSARNSWLAPQYITQASIVSQDLKLTGTEPSWMTAVRTENDAVAATTSGGSTVASATGTANSTAATTTSTVGNSSAAVMRPFDFGMEVLGAAMAGMAIVLALL